MALGELFLALIIGLASGIGSMVPVAAYLRTREPRFLLVAGGALCLLALGTVWAYGQAVSNPPSYTQTSLAALALTTLAALLWLSSGLVPRRA
jgi:hypothetical protein